MKSFLLTLDCICGIVRQPCLPDSQWASSPLSPRERLCYRGPAAWQRKPVSLRDKAGFMKEARKLNVGRRLKKIKDDGLCLNSQQRSFSKAWASAPRMLQVLCCFPTHPAVWSCRACAMWTSPPDLGRVFPNHPSWESFSFHSNPTLLFPYPYLMFLDGKSLFCSLLTM